MNKPLSLLALAVMAGSAFAQEKNLFNGTDLAGWEGNMALWSVKDGVIHGETKPDEANPKKSALRHNTFLVWKGGTPGDFDLKLKFRITSEAGNSGIQYRSKAESEGPDGPIISGYQADFEAGKTYSGILYEERGRGILAKRGEQVVVKPDPADASKVVKEVTGTVGDSQAIQDGIKISEWNEYRVIAHGNHLEHFINGMKTIEVTDQHEKGAKAGVLALQMHAGPPMTVEFKDIKLTEIK